MLPRCQERMRDSKSIRTISGPYITCAMRFYSRSWNRQTSRDHRVSRDYCIRVCVIKSDMASGGNSTCRFRREQHSRTLGRTIRFVLHIVITRWCLIHSAGRVHRSLGDNLDIELILATRSYKTQVHHCGPT